MLYIKYNDGTSSQWVIVPPSVSAATIGAVAYTPQSPTTSEQVQARKNVYAAPFDALAYNGMQINGGLQVSQEVGAAAVTTITGNHIADGWRAYKSGTMVTNTTIVTDAPPGHTNSIKLNVTTAKASLVAGEELELYCNVEGYRTVPLAFGTASAQSMTMAFWTKIHRPGTYTGLVVNEAYNRGYPFTYTHSVADTWEYKTITIPGDVTGTWRKDNGAGMAVYFTVAAHSSLLNTPGSWTGTPGSGATGQINGVAATSDTFQLTGVVLLPGTEAPSAARSALIMRPYDQELVTCQRYWQKLENIIVDTPSASQSTIFLCTMRSNPTIASIPGPVSIAQLTPSSAQFHATGRAYQTLTLDARL